jgi:TPR repeat protein
MPSRNSDGPGSGIRRALATILALFALVCGAESQAADPTYDELHGWLKKGADICVQREKSGGNADDKDCLGLGKSKIATGLGAIADALGGVKSGARPRLPEYPKLKQEAHNCLWENTKFKGKENVFFEQISYCSPQIARACLAGDADHCEMVAEALFYDLPSRAKVLEFSCDAGHSGACHNLGVFYSQGRGVAKDEAKAVSFYQKACDLEERKACFNLGLFYSQGRGVAKDEAKAVSFYQKACDLKDEAACFNLGVFYDKGRGVAKDEAKAVSFYQKACDLEERMACFNLGLSYSQGLGVAKDEAKAVSFYQKACDLEHGKACRRLAVSYSEGNGAVKQNHAKARELYEKACSYDNSLCNALGLKYMSGDGVPRDESKGVWFFQQSCDKKNAEACHSLAIGYGGGRGVKQDQDKANALYRQNCEMDYGKSCVSLGYSYERGRGLVKDEAKAAAWYKKACDLKYGDGCNNLSTLYSNGRGGLAKDEAKSAELNDKACEYGSAAGCFRRGYAYLKGEGVTRDDKKAFDLFYKGCVGSNDADARACDYAARLKGREKDYKKAARYEAYAILLEPDDAGYHDSLGFYRREAGELDQALEALNKAIVLDPEEANPYANRAIAYSLKGEACKAVTDARKVCTLNKANGVECLEKMVGTAQEKQEFAKIKANQAKCP